MSGPIISLENVTKHYGSVVALDSVSTEIQQGEFFSLLGPSGCGKTTLLRTIAGFEVPTSGHVEIDGISMDGVPANKRPTNMVFQSYAIFPHMSVGENVGFGLRRKGLSKTEMAKQVAEALEMVGLSGYEPRASHAMSGGQRQRVALARALVMRPKVLLLDEPLSALDKKLREQMQYELRQLQRAVGITFVLVTHDQEEALTMSDRIAVMFDGQISQLASPQDLYRRPINRQVADFIGVMNFLDADVQGETGNALDVDVQGLGKVTLDKSHAPDGISGGVSAGIRPEMLTLLFSDHETAEREAGGQVVSAAYYGDMTYYDVKLDGVEQPVTITMRNTAGRQVLGAGDRTRIGWGAESIVLLK